MSILLYVLMWLKSADEWQTVKPQIRCRFLTAAYLHTRNTVLWKEKRKIFQRCNSTSYLVTHIIRQEF